MAAIMQLYSYQQEAVNKLAPVRAVLLADQMGLGKTPTAIVMDKLRRQHEDGPHKTLVIAPLSVLGSWVNHFAEWAPELTVRRIDPKHRDLLLTQPADVYIVHWDALRLMPELVTQKWLHVIADEAHRAKNRKAQQTKALKKIPASYKTALTGTPIPNRPDDLWSILNWLYPKQYRSYWKFYEQYVLYETIYPHGYHKILGPKNVAQLQADIAPFYMRRLKTDVLDLPEKYYTTIDVDLTPPQRRIYNEMKRDMIAWLGMNESVPLIAPVAVARLIRLQQFSAAYAHYNDITGTVILAEPSSKLDTLMEIIKDNPDEQIVVFTQYAQLVRLAQRRLEAASIPYSTVTGHVSGEQRDLEIQHFQEGKTRILLGTVQAGGVGITLTAASTVVFLDRDWSPAVNEQAEDRLHRIGQRNAVQVIDIVARNSADPGKLATVGIKADWIRRVLGD